MIFKAFDVMLSSFNPIISWLEYSISKSGVEIISTSNKHYAMNWKEVFVDFLIERR